MSAPGEKLNFGEFQYIHREEGGFQTSIGSISRLEGISMVLCRSFVLLYVSSLVVNRSGFYF